MSTSPSQSVVTSPADPTGRLRHIRSDDGTTVVLERVTQGQIDLVLIGGGPTLRGSWSRVATQLDGAASCWLMDRRGKGDSGDTAPYSFEREYADLAAVVASFPGPVGLAGHSSGATVALGAALRGVPLASLILYEPPWPVDGPLAGADDIDRVEALIDEGDPDAALELAFRRMVGLPADAVAALRHSPMWPEWKALAHTWPREMREASALPRDLSDLGAVNVPTLFIVGAETSPHLQRSTRALAAALSRASVVELPGQGHGALALAPQLVAGAVLDFISHAGAPSVPAHEYLDADHASP